MSLYANKKKAITESRQARKQIPDGVYNCLWDDATIKHGSRKSTDSQGMSITFKVWDKASEFHKKKITKYYAFGTPSQANEGWVIGNRGQFWDLMTRLGVPVDNINSDEDLTEVFDEIKLRPPQLEITIVNKEDSQYPNIYINMEDVPQIFEEEEEVAGSTEVEEEVGYTDPEAGEYTDPEPEPEERKKPAARANPFKKRG